METVNHRTIHKKHRQALHKMPNVVATGIGIKMKNGKPTGQTAIICSVRKKQPASMMLKADIIPDTLDGVPTDVIETGVIKALASRTVRVRPAPGGVSIGHRDITAGTLGCLVKKNGLLYILSNNHVLANSNAGKAGDPILQPGPYDGGTLPLDQIASLSEFVPISFEGDTTPPPDPGDPPSDCPVGNAIASVLNGIARVFGRATRLSAVVPAATENLVDCAIARPINDGDVMADIMEVGVPAGVALGSLGMGIKKSGRTTGLLTDTILQIDVTVQVQYGEGQIALFTDQLMAGPMSQGGDSGSAVLDNQNNLVGLLFAGSDTTTIINRIEHVFSALNVTL